MGQMVHGGRLIAQTLRREGVDCLFTLAGGHIAAIYDGCLDEGVRVVDTRHEQSATHAAAGWARVTGRPGVVAVTAGPGVTNAVTSVATAFRSGTPLVVLGGAGPRVFRDMGSLQDMDHVTLMRSVTKWSATVPETRRLPEYLTAAFRKAMAGVPGPVFLELPLDVLMELVDADTVAIPSHYRTEARPGPDPRAVDTALAVLRGAERPVAIVGSQLRWSRQPIATLRAFVDTTGIPTFVNGMARGMIDPTGPHFLNRARRFALKRADAVLIFGTPFDFRLGYGQSDKIVAGSQSGRAGSMLINLTTPGINPEAAVIQVDLDGAEIGRNRSRGVDVGLVADSGLALAALTDGLSDLDPSRLDPWRATVRAHEAERWAKMAREIDADGDPPNPLRVCHEVTQFVRPGDIIVGDGGDFVGTAAYVMKPFGVSTWLDPGPLGTLGVGPGYALAAKLARPDARVVLMWGDGSFGLHPMELEAMARQHIPIVAIIGNDAAWTQIRRGQAQLYGASKVVATELAHTPYHLVAEACGCHGELVERSAELRPALRRAFAADRPAVINVTLGASAFRSGAVSV